MEQQNDPRGPSWLRLPAFQILSCMPLQKVESFRNACRCRILYSGAGRRNRLLGNLALEFQTEAIEGKYAAIQGNRQKKVSSNSGCGRLRRGCVPGLGFASLLKELSRLPAGRRDRSEEHTSELQS